MDTAKPRDSLSVRRIRMLAIVVGVVVALYTIGWHWVGNRIVTMVAGELETLRATGTLAECERPAAKGFPFRMGLFCRSVAFRDGASQASVSAGALRTTAVVYRPTLVIGELDGPARIDLPGLVPLAADWDSARASVRVSQPLPERISLVVDSIRLDERLDGEERRAVSTLRLLEAHFRTRNGNAADVALSLSGFETAGLSPLGLSADAGWNDAARLAALIETGNGAILRGTGGELRNLSLAPESGGSIALKGPLSFDADGYLDADLTITIIDGDKLAATLRQAGLALGLPLGDAAQMIENAATIANGQPLPVTIRRGQATVGFIPLGSVPPL